MNKSDIFRMRKSKSFIKYLKQKISPSDNTILAFVHPDLLQERKKRRRSADLVFMTKESKQYQQLVKRQKKFKILFDKRQVEIKHEKEELRKREERRKQMYESLRK